MNINITPSNLKGEIRAVSSKSDAHRSLICAALSRNITTIHIDSSSEDIEATISCLTAMGDNVLKSGNKFTVKPISRKNTNSLLDCRESGSTLRFLLPVAGLICERPTLTGSGRLPLRPLSPLKEEMEAHGCTFSSPSLPVMLSGKLGCGTYTLPGNISSQYISGLMLALPLCDGDSNIILTSPLESKGYVNMTISILKKFAITIVEHENGYYIKGNQAYVSPGSLTVEGDWSNAAFWLCAAAISGNITVSGISFSSNQGDKRIASILELFGADVCFGHDSVSVKSRRLNAITLDCSDIPDLVPVISAVAAVSCGTTRLTGVARLRLKESDRLNAIKSALGALGADIDISENTLIINGKQYLSGGDADGFNDHRIVMMTAVAACASKDTVTIRGCEAVNKSYPRFFDDYKLLGGAPDVI